MSPDVIRKLQDFIAKGATIVGSKPAKSYSLTANSKNDRYVQQVARSLWDPKKSENAVISNKTARQVLNEKGIQSDFSYKMYNTNDTLDYIHRQTGDAEIYFVRNVRGSKVSANLMFRVDSLRPEIWNSEDGTVSNVQGYTQGNGSTGFMFSFGPFESRFFVFRHSSASDQKLKFLPMLQKDIFVHHLKGQRQIEPERGSHIRLSRNINGPWMVQFPVAGQLVKDTLQKLIPLNESSDQRLKFFSGNIVYETSFNWEAGDLKTGGRILLRLNKVREIADVVVNGKHVSTVWHGPFQSDVTDALKPGTNQLRIEVVNSPNNALVGDAKAGARKMRSNINRLPNAWSKPMAEAPLLEAGLIGPVELVFLIPQGQ
jgi:hypothetical protein